MKYKLRYSKAYKKGIKKLNNSDRLLLENILSRLANGEKLERKYKNHALKGKLKRIGDCHIKADLVLLYKKEEDILSLTALAIGSHSEMF